MQTRNNNKKLSVLRKNWTVAELQVSYKSKQKTKVKITDSHDAYKVFIQMWDKSLINIQEQYCALFLNSINEVISFRVISTGELSSTLIDIQLLLACALLCRASKIITAHNHPSGNHEPSEEDEESAQQIRRAAEYMDIELFDDLIITEKSFSSLADNLSVAFKDELRIEEEDNTPKQAENKKTIRLFGLPIFSIES